MLWQILNPQVPNYLEFLKEIPCLFLEDIIPNRGPNQQQKWLFR